MILPNFLSYKALKHLRTVFCLLLVSGFFVLPVQAQEEEGGDPYTVANIEVDVTADNAVEAREKAFEKAQLKGYEALAQRFLSEEELDTFEVPEINTVSSYVKDYEVTNEQLSAVRYKGTYTIRFSSRSFAKANNGDGNQQVSMSQDGEVLILPFYESGGQYFLWQSNPFMQAWSRASGTDQAGSAIVPIGDAEDIAQVQDHQALSYDPSRLNAMRLRYQAADAALMIASPERVPEGMSVLVSMYKTKAYGPVLAQQFSLRRYPNETDEQLYNRVVSRASQELHKGWKQEPVATTQNEIQEAPLTGPESTIIAQMNFNSARQWVDAKRSIERARGVKSVQVKSLSPRMATLDIRFVGDVQNLRTSLQRQGVTMNQSIDPNKGAVYQLRQTSGLRQF